MTNVVPLNGRKPCPHDNFLLHSRVARILKGNVEQDEGTLVPLNDVAYYALELKVECAACHEVFQFKSTGMRVGASPYRITSNYDETELRIPMVAMGGHVPVGLPAVMIDAPEREGGHDG